MTHVRGTQDPVDPHSQPPAYAAVTGDQPPDYAAVTGDHPPDYYEDGYLGTPVQGQGGIPSSDDAQLPEVPPNEGDFQAHLDNLINQVKTTLEANEWLTSTSCILQLLQALYELARTTGKAHIAERVRSIDLNTATAEVGMLLADLAKELKTLEANKEKARAMGSFVNAGLAAGQAALNMKAFSASRDEANAKYADRLSKGEANLKNANEEKAPSGTEDEALQKWQAGKDENVEKMTGELNAIRDARDNDARSIYQYKSTQIGAGHEAMKSSVDGSVSLYSASQMGADLEKAKEALNVIRESLNKVLDSVNKAKDDFGNQFQKLIDEIMRTVTEYFKAHEFRIRG